MKNLITIYIIAAISFMSYKSTGQCTTPISLSIMTASATCSICCNGSATLIPSGGCPAYSYTINPSITSFTSICPGNYTVLVMDAGCCPMGTATFTMKYMGAPASINEVNAGQLEVFVQNPNQDQINLIFDKQSKESNYEITITDLQNRIVLHEQVTVSNFLLSFYHGLTNGAYFITIRQPTTNKTSKKKIIINN
jgi:hypothetical protein